MAGKRFPIGDLITLVGAAVAAGGVTLTWFTLHVTASQGTATFSLWGWQYALGWVACIAAGVGGVVGLVGLIAGGRLGRIGGFMALACGLVALAAVGIQLADKPDVGAMNKQIGSAFGAADLAAYNQKMTGWTVSESTVETGIGVWVALAGGLLVLVGGGLTAVLGGKKAPAIAAGWQSGEYAPDQQSAVYGQSPYQPVAGAYPGAGQPLPPPPGAPPAPAFAPPVAAYAEVAPQPAAAVEPPPVGVPASQPAPVVAPAKFCAKCGGPFSDDQSRFCVKCGAPRPGVG